MSAVFPIEREAITPTSEPAKSLSYATAVLSADYQSAQFNTDHHLHAFVDITITQGLSESIPDNALARFRFPFQRAVLMRGEYVAGPDLSLKVDAITALDRYDLLIRPSLTYRFARMLEATAELHWLQGSDAGFFGVHSRNSRVGLRLEANY